LRSPCAPPPSSPPPTPSRNALPSSPRSPRRRGHCCTLSLPLSLHLAPPTPSSDRTSPSLPRPPLRLTSTPATPTHCSARSASRTSPGRAVSGSCPSPAPSPPPTSRTAPPDAHTPLTHSPSLA